MFKLAKDAIIFKKLYDIYTWIKPRLLSLVILIISVFLFIYLHSEYISWVELSGDKTFLTLSYIIKNILILLAVIVFIFLNRSKKVVEVKKDYKQIKAEKVQMEKKKDHIKSIKEKGELPLNVIFLVEGEEEIGSPNLVPFLEKNKESLACDIIAVSDTGMVAPGVPTLGYGLRGITCLEVTVKGPKGDLHSGVYGGCVANPATAAARMVASLHDEDGKIAVAGFYDDVIPLQDWEREMWAQVPNCADEDFLKTIGSPEPFGEPGYSMAECLWGRPTVEVNGIGGGYQGEGSKTVIPAQAMFKLSCRLVPGQDPAKVQQQVEDHLRAHTPKGVTVEIKKGHSGKAYHNDPHSKYGKAAQVALTKSFGREPVLIREGGSIPIIQDMKEILGADSLMLGLALPDCQIHAPNENFAVENFEGGIVMSQILLEQLASL